MRKILFPAATVALLATSLGAFAADTHTTGKIKSVDLKAMTLTLEDGTAYVLPVGFKDPGLKAGMKVDVAWQMKNSKHDADSVTIAK
jgi:hypothetical protein